MQLWVDAKHFYFGTIMDPYHAPAAWISKGMNAWIEEAERLGCKARIERDGPPKLNAGLMWAIWLTLAGAFGSSSEPLECLEFLHVVQPDVSQCCWCRCFALPWVQSHTVSRMQQWPHDGLQ